MSNNVILFTGTTHDIYWYNRPAGAYKVVSHLRKNKFDGQVIPNCTALTRLGYQQVFKKYGSESLLWFGFTSNWLAGIKSDDYYDQWWNSKRLTIDEKLEGWMFTEVDDREQVYSCTYKREMLDEIWSMAMKFNPDVKMVMGGSQLNRNEYFHPKDVHLHATYVKQNGEVPALELTRRYAKGNFKTEKLPSNNDYDYGEFKKSFISYKETDHIEPNEWLSIEVARGCAFKCAFCNYDMKGVTNNYIDAKYLRKKIIEHHKKWGTTKFVIMDDLYNDNHKKVKDLYENCWSKLPFKPELAGYLRLDLLWKKPEMAKMLYDSGFRAGSFGIETLHDKAGKAVGKGLGKKRIIETLEMLKEVWGRDVLIHGFFIAGLPHETKENLMETVKWLKNTDLIHAVIWHWLELENIKKIKDNVDKLSILGENPVKYGYQFYNDNEWVNNAGVTLADCKDINRMGNNAKMNTYFTMYADMRALGWSHKEIVATSLYPNFAGKLGYRKFFEWQNSVKKLEAVKRLIKIIT